MYTVIVADDEIELRQSLIETIDWEKIGFKVIGEAENGVEALELVEELEPDLLLTDIKMPFISGIDLARKVREIRPAMQIAFLSGYDDFSYAQQAIQYNIIKYLLKPISKDEITKELEDIKEKMDDVGSLFTKHKEIDVQQLRMNQFLMSLLLDNDNVGDELFEERMNQIAYDLNIRQSLDDKSRYVVVVTRFFDRFGEVITDEQHLNAINTVAYKYLRCGSFYSHGKIVSLLSGMEWEIEKYLDIITNEIVQITKRVVDQDCYIGISGIVDQITKAHSAYVVACNAIEYGVGVRLNISYIEDIERVDTIQYEYVESISSQLERLLKSKDVEEVVKFISALFIEIIDSHMARADVDLLIVHMITTTCTIARSLCDDESVNLLLKKAADISSIVSEQSFNEKRKAITEFCVYCKELILKQNRLNSVVICDELIALIDKEYSNDEFSLSMASEQLHVSISYLSALIKKVKGESFVALLTKKRMEVAKDMVMYSSAKLLEIASQCGYNDQHYFSYCFKRQYGVSPHKMREQEK